MPRMTPEQYVQDKARQSASSLYYASRFLPPARRQAMTAFHALRREIDDIAVEVADPGVAATKLDWWRREVDASFAGQPSHPVTKALMPHVGAYGVRVDHLHALIQGCQTDLEQTRFLDYAGLQRYCHQVAGIAGEVASNIMGRTQGQTVKFAHQLGLAMKLTALVRDVGDDARHGRLYLPISELQQFDVKAAEILQREAPWGYSERFTALMKFQAARADALFDEALALLPDEDRATQRPALMLANIYRRLLREVEATGFQVLHQRIALTPLRKLWIASKTQWRGR